MMSFRKLFFDALATGLILAAVGTTPAQVGEFGRNKTTSEMHDWRYVQTPHFDIYFYEGMEDLARIATTIIEEAYEQISASLDYRVRNRIPIMLFRSRLGFSETHVTSGLIGEGTGGLTEFLKNRIAVPFEGSYPMFRHVLHHELTHAVQNDMLYGRDVLSGVQQSDIPLWFVEGLAEYESTPWTAESDMWMRDAVINDYLQLNGYFAYKGGQSIMYYIAEVYGPGKIAQINHRLRSFSRFGSTMQAILGVDMEEFGEKWEKDLKKVYWPEIVEREEPDEVAEMLTDHEEDDSGFNRSPSFSPYGDKIAYLTTDDYRTSIHVMSAIDGKFLWQVVTGEGESSFEEMHWQRAAIAWSPDAARIAFAAKATEGDRLYVVNSHSGERLDSYDFDLDGIYSPDWSPDGERIAFVGLKNGKADLYLVQLSDGSLTRLTDDRFSESDPKWSPDGTRLLFSTDRAPGLTDNAAQLLYQTADIYLMDVETRSMRRLTDNPRDDTSPEWGPDGNHIVFVSDRNGVFNLYIADVTGDYGTLESSAKPLTDLLTGAFHPSWSRSGDKIAFAGFNKGGWDILVMRDPLEKLKNEPLEPAFFMREGRLSYSSVHKHGRTEPSEATSPDSMHGYAIGPRMKPGGLPSFDIVQNTSTDSARGGFVPRRYRTKLGVDYVTGFANYSTVGGVGGQLVVAASDLLGHHQVVFATSLYRDLRDSDYAVFYQYLARKTNYGVYLAQQRTWYPFQSFTESGLVERSQQLAGLFASRPISQFDRIEFGIEGMRNTTRVVYDFPPLFGAPIDEDQIEAFLTTAAFVHDNTLWSMFWPVTGSRWRVSLTSAPPRANTAPFGILTADLRRYFRVGENSSFAIRGSGGISLARNNEAPLFYLGGLPYWINYKFANLNAASLTNDAFSQLVFPLRGADYYELRGRRYAMANLEYRFPLIYFLAAGFPFKLIFSNIGGVLFLDMAKVWDVPRGYETDSPDVTNNMIGGYGYGIRVNLGLMLLRVDVAWKTDLRDTYGDARYYWSLGYDF